MINPPVRSWQIWSVDFPFMERSESKIRPGIILMSPMNRLVSCLYVTSKVDKPHQDLLLLRDWQSEGLDVPSAVRLQRRIPVSPDQICRFIGVLSDRDRKNVILGLTGFHTVFGS
jgi:hypothetical protein